MATKTKSDRKAEDTQSLSDTVARRQMLKEQLDALTEDLKSLDAEIIERFKSEGISKFETPLGKINLIEASTIVWNDEVLEGILSTAQWNRVTIRKVDKVRLEAEILVGRINEDDILVAKSVKQSKPYLR